MPENPTTADGKALPFVAPCRTLQPSAPLGWVRKGWTDLRRAPGQSLAYGAVIALLSWLVTGVALKFGTYWAALILLSGFVFIAPVLALGLYSISRQLGLGQKPSLGRCFGEQKQRLGTAMVFALALMVVFLVWARAGSMLHVFFPVEAEPDWSQIATFLAIGSAVGSIFALITFAFSAFSLPMICDRDADAITAVVTSINAVLRNKLTMLIWAAIIVSFVAVGFLTFFVGFIVFLPLIGHATWHAYRDTIDASEWPEKDKY